MPRGPNLNEFKELLKEKLVTENASPEKHDELRDYFGKALIGLWYCEDGHELYPLQVRRRFGKYWKGVCSICQKEMFYDEQG